MKPVVTPVEMQEVDERAISELGIERLIDRAGYATAMVAHKMLGGLYGRAIAIVVGKGHNGDDGRSAGHHLTARGAKVMVIEVADCPESLPAVDLTIDAAFGTGFHGSYSAPNVADHSLVLAIDIPSGVDGVTGIACPGAVRADVTITFGAHKPGLLFADGPDHAGEVVLDPIGLEIDKSDIWLVEDSDLFGSIPVRDHSAHKWKRAVVIVAGSPGMTGAAHLSSLSALRAGASMVRLGAPGVSATEFDVIEAVSLNLPLQGAAVVIEDELHRAHSLIIGPGLGGDAHVVGEIREIIAQTEIPMVIDADGLNALGRVAKGDPILFPRNKKVVLTPHDGEFARLLGRTPGDDRISSARELAELTGAVVLLKGATTIVAGPTGPTLLVNSGTSALATAGTGDVLSGVIGALLAQGLTPMHAAAFGAHLHGRAGSMARSGSLIASDLPQLIANAIALFVHPLAGSRDRK